MKKNNPELLHGTLELLILRLVRHKKRHGYEIAKSIQAFSKEQLTIGQGSLYPALHRLKQKGLISSSWGQSETGRKVKFYELTSDGLAQLKEETHHWHEFSEMINLILREG